MSQDVLAQGLSEVRTAAEGPVHMLGEKVTVAVVGPDGNRYQATYIYVVAGGTIAAGVYCSYNGDTPFEAIVGYVMDESNLTSAGVSMAALAAGEYGWLTYEGCITQKTLAVAASSLIIADATTGVLTAGAIGTPLNTAVGMVDITDVLILFPPGQRGLAPDA